MCGIYEFYSIGATKWSRQQFDSMGEAIKHRGPNHTGAFFAGHVAIGNQRLSIIDVEDVGHKLKYYSEADLKLRLGGGSLICNIYRESR